MAEETINIEPHVTVLKDRCKGCRLCIEVCPKQVLKQSDELNRKGYRFACADARNGCIHCNLCELICPDFAIIVAPKE